ncbi:hypothetical protein HANVADRAFT_98694 [Hanseniaspora valbyensis NRRL Y-1626]|uniref:Uncharacterized protein n=1 Tax=Hanseniaspora valbyensis NRRL Y-1626 TaxID=766949 RepID=A0A1B7THQ2_9ASCO|nr:hypothetical protein HANVADRAFT_98694 [Hanseniaspora valbyensis NRRL Y-1626]
MMTNGTQEINHNILLDKAIATLNNLFFLEDNRLINIYFNIITSNNNTLDVHKLHIFLKLYLTKINTLNDLNDKHLQIILNHMVLNRFLINDDAIIFDILKLILDKERNDDNKNYINILSFIILKVIFIFSNVPTSESLNFLQTQVIEKTDSEQLATICPGILTNLIKILKLDLKHSIPIFKSSIDNLSALLIKIQNKLSSNEKILVYQSIDTLFKGWSNMNFSYERNNIIIEDLCAKLSQFELVNELVCIEYIYRSNKDITDRQLLYFDKDQVLSILINKLNLIDVFYFDSKHYKLFANGLYLLSRHSDVDISNLANVFKQFVDIPIDGKPINYNKDNNNNIELPNFINLKEKEKEENNDNNNNVTDLMIVDVKSDLELHECVIERYVPLDIRDKWVSLVNIWVNIINKQFVLDLIAMMDIDERKQALYYYILFHIENKKASDNDIDQFLTFEEDENDENDDDLLLDHFIELIDTPTESLPISTLYFIANFITTTQSYNELREVEIDLLPILLTNINNPLSQYILQNLSQKIYPTNSTVSSFKKMIQTNTDLILSHITTIIVSSKSTERHWIVFTKSVFEVCGMDLVRKAGDVVNLMFQVLAVDSISSFHDLRNYSQYREDTNMMEVMSFFGVVLDLILAEYSKYEVIPKIEQTKKMTINDVIDLFKKNSIEEYEEEEDDDDVVEEEIIANGVVSDIPNTSIEETSFEGIIPQQIYKLVIEILAYIERCFPMIHDKKTTIENISKIISIMKMNEKSFKPQLAQSIWPLIEKYIQQEAENKIKEFKLTVKLIIQIVKLEPQFMFQRVKNLYLSFLIKQTIGSNKIACDALSELGHVIILLDTSFFAAGSGCTDNEAVRIRNYLK